MRRPAPSGRSRSADKWGPRGWWCYTARAWAGCHAARSGPQARSARARAQQMFGGGDHTIERDPVDAAAVRVVVGDLVGGKSGVGNEHSLAIGADGDSGPPRVGGAEEG